MSMRICFWMFYTLPVVCLFIYLNKTILIIDVLCYIFISDRTSVPSLVFFFLQNFLNVYCLFFCINIRVTLSNLKKLNPVLFLFFYCIKFVTKLLIIDFLMLNSIILEYGMPFYLFKSSFLNLSALNFSSYEPFAFLKFIAKYLIFFPL